MNKLIIFDCDGVLVDSETIANRVYAEVITSLGYTLSTEDCIKHFSGISCKMTQEIIEAESGIRLPEELAQLADDAILAALEKGLAPLMLDVLNHDILRGVDKCIASNSSKSKILRSLAQTKQDSFFNPEHVFSAAQVGKEKPAPDLFLYAARQVGYEPKDCIVIEDSLAGIQAARAANMDVIGFLGGGHASFDWYKDRISAQNIPVASNHKELISIIQKFTNN